MKEISISDERDLVVKLIKATHLHIWKRTVNKKDKEAYSKVISSCTHVCETFSPALALTELKDMLSTRNKTFKQHLEIFANTDFYQQLAIKHCIDIINSIQTRFVDGYSSPEDTFVNTILINEENNARRKNNL